MTQETSTTSSGPLAEISHGPSAFEAFLDRNQKNLIILAMLLAISAAVYVVYDGIRQGVEDSAGAALNKASDLASLQAVASKEGTSSAPTAMAFLGNLQWKEGQQDDSVKTLESLLAAHPEHPVAECAKASLAAKLMSQGMLDQAKSQFQALAESKDSFAAPFAQISLGDMAIAENDATNAETFYKKVQQEYPGNAFADTASRRLVSLKAKDPVEVEPPPTPPAEKANDDDVVSPEMSLPSTPAFEVDPVEAGPES